MPSELENVGSTNASRRAHHLFRATLAAMWAGDVETPEDWRHRREQNASAREAAADARKDVFSRYQDVTPSLCAEIIALLQRDVAPLD
jgi:hypothetical protein